MKKSTTTVPPWLRSAASGEGLFSTLGATSPQPGEQPTPTAVVERDIGFTVEGEEATGRLFEPDGLGQEHTGITNLVVAVQGNGAAAATHAAEMRLLAAAADTAIITLDQRSGASVWRTGEFNISHTYQDVIAAVRWYREHNPQVQQVVLWSWSQGSLAAGLAAARAPEGTFAGWVSAMAIDDAGWFWSQLHALAPAGTELPPPLGALVAQVEKDAGGTPAEKPSAYAQRTLYAREVVGRLRMLPVILLHGTADQRVPFARGVRLWQAIKAGQAAFYEIRAGRDTNGDVVPAGHTRNDLNPGETRLGPVWWESHSAVIRLLTGTEKTAGDPYTVIELREARGL